MTNQEIDFILEQIRSIVLNKPLSPINSEDGDFSDVQQSLTHLSNCLIESNLFLKELANGNLNATVPSRNNFLAGSLKELHAGLKHLTWQANQVAKGDYCQSVSFLGEFSSSFNQMISQLREREQKLKNQSHCLSQSNLLLQSIMNSIGDFIIVLSQETKEIIYSNGSANSKLLNNDKCTCEDNCAILDFCKNICASIDVDYRKSELHCPQSNKIYSIDAFLLMWNETQSCVFRIIDVTHERFEHEHIQSLVYKDELTGLFNRRYFQEKMEDLVQKNTEFTLCMIDVDKLKYANDNFGHIAGDEYLKFVGKEISNIARSSDVVCRLGGDEFSTIFIGCAYEHVITKMQNVNKKLKTISAPYPMQISFGAVHVPSDNIMSVNLIMASADSKMYDFKNGK